MRDLVSSVSPKGQVTISQVFRKRLGINPKDRVVFSIDGDTLKLETLRSRLDAIYQSVPALDAPRPREEVKAIAHEERAQELVRKWREP